MGERDLVKRKGTLGAMKSSEKGMRNPWGGAGEGLAEERGGHVWRGKVCLGWLWRLMAEGRLGRSRGQLGRDRGRAVRMRVRGVCMCMCEASVLGCGGGASINCPWDGKTLQLGAVLG